MYMQRAYTRLYNVVHEQGRRQGSIYRRAVIPNASVAKAFLLYRLMYLRAVAHNRTYRDLPGSSWLMQPRSRVWLGGTCTLCKTECKHSLRGFARRFVRTNHFPSWVNMSDKIKNSSRDGETRRLLIQWFMLDDRTCTPLFVCRQADGTLMRVADPTSSCRHPDLHHIFSLQPPTSPTISHRHTRRIASEAPNSVSVLPMWLRCGVYMTSDSGRMVSALVACTI
jgi:hypothetical protein